MIDAHYRGCYLPPMFRLSLVLAALFLPFAAPAADLEPRLAEINNLLTMEHSMGSVIGIARYWRACDEELASAVVREISAPAAKRHVFAVAVYVRPRKLEEPCATPPSVESASFSPDIPTENPDYTFARLEFHAVSPAK